VYDGLMSGHNISFGPGGRRNLNEDYKAAKDRLGVITSLPLSEWQRSPSATGKPAKTAGRQRSTARTGAAQEVVEIILGMTDGFCRQHLNDEYADLCRELAGKLARKRPSPLLSGRPEGWACGIVRTI